MRPVKCQRCGEKSSKDQMEFEIVGKTKPLKKYYHKHCYQDFLKEKDFKEKEMRELDNLKETIEDIFNIKQLPNQAYPFLQKLRNGDPVFGRQSVGKRYKEGYKYSLIEETFRHCEDTINYWLGVKNFNGFMGAFKYSLSIVIDKIYFVEQRAKEKEYNIKMVKEHLKHLTNEEDSMFESNYKKASKTQDDISDFLDD